MKTLSRLLVPLVLILPAAAQGPPRPAPETREAPVRATDGEVLRIYDVRDLHAQRPLQEGATDEDRAAREEAMEVDYGRLAEMLVELLEANLGPLEAPTQQVRMARGGSLVANLTVAQHEFAEDFLTFQREVADAQYLLEVKFVLVPSDLGGKILPEESPAFLDDEQIGDLLLAIQRSKSEVLSAPSVLVEPRQRAEIVTVEQIAYVKDWEIHEHVEPGDQTILDPIIGVLEDGVRLTARVVPLAEGRNMVDLQVTQMEVKRPIPTFETTLGIPGSPKVTIALPESVKRTIETRLVLGGGETAVLATDAPQDGKRSLVLARVEKILPD
jgi:hypothetical protein